MQGHGRYLHVPGWMGISIATLSVHCASQATWLPMVEGRTVQESAMSFVLVVIAWCVLFAVAWPLALLAIVLLPLFWLLSLPFRIFGVLFDAVLALIKAVLFLPARLLGHRG